MLVWRGLDDVPAERTPSVLTIGVFDGVHRGHRQVIERVVQVATGRGRAVVVTFDPHPMAVLRPEAAPERLATLDHRLQLLAEAGVDATLVLPFTRELAGWSAEDFVRRVLVEALDATCVVVGTDFRFGRRAAGDVALLRELGAVLGFEVAAVPLLSGAEGRLSSSQVRAALAVGDVGTAAEVLGRPHRVEGPVVPGDRRGRQLGYPTANLNLPAGTAIPADGIYAGWLSHGGARMPAAISIGTNPTFAGVGRRVEAHALDRDDLELYGEWVLVEFAARLRETVRFYSVEALVAQMARDVEGARLHVTATG